MKKNIIIFTIVLSFVGISCGDDALTLENDNQQTTGTYFKNGAELSSAVTSIYAALQSTNLISREWFFLHDLRSDEMASGGGHLEAHRNQILIGSHDPGNVLLSGVWNMLYRLVHRANAVLTYGPETEMEEGLRTRLMGEANFLRAWAYFELYTLWGGVPIYETFATDLEGAMPRSSAEEVKAFIVSDLTTAIERLPESYGSSDYGRVTSIAAKMLMGKLHMFDSQYADAKPFLEEVVAYGEAQFGNPLMDQYFDNFKEETEFNKESIWEIVYTSTGNYNWDGDGNDYGPNESWIRSQEYSAVGWRNLIPSDKLLAEFEDEDPRLTDNFYFTGDKYGDPGAQKTLTDDAQRGNSSTFNGSPAKISWKKYSVMYKLDPGGFYDKSGINYRMMRYADAYLMLAEIENEIGTADKALEYLNKTRNRASVNMPEYPTAEYPTATKTDIMEAIMHERMVEFAGEEIRNFDILRWRKAGKFSEEPIPYFETKYQLLPIPQSELDANDKMDQADQNPGY
jgi:starch-binding outer membrane protein, SusD/RagB family